MIPLMNGSGIDIVTKTVVEIPGVPTDRSMFEGVDFTNEAIAKRVPTWTITEVAKVFFQKSAAWLRLKEKDGHLLHADGTPIVPTRTQSNIRQYTLSDIEEMILSLYGRSVINFGQMVNSLLILRNIGIGYRVVHQVG